MTLAELRAALEAMDQEAFERFRKEFGGDYPTPQGYVNGYVHHPEWERRLSQLHAIPTQDERLANASIASAHAAVESAKSARLSMIWSALAVLVAIVALWISAAAR